MPRQSDPRLTADRIIGYHLYADTTIKAYTFPGAPNTVYKTFAPGASVGKVWSFVIRAGQVWWQFERYPGSNDYYFIKQSTDLSLSENDYKKIIEKIEHEEAVEEEANTFKGVEYYLKKYGIWVLGALVLSGAAKGYLSRK